MINCDRIKWVVVEGIGKEQSGRLGNISKLNLMQDIITNNLRCFSRKKEDYRNKHYKTVWKLRTYCQKNQESTSTACANYLYCIVLYLFI